MKVTLKEQTNLILPVRLSSFFLQLKAAHFMSSSILLASQKDFIRI